jgi:hypothetical protein
MKYGLLAVLCAVLTFFSIASRAETNVVEAFACDFLPGNSMTDLDSVTDFYASQRSKIKSPALQKMVSRVWTQDFGAAPYDFVWFNSNMTFTEWAEMRQAFSTSPLGNQIQAKFDAVSECARSGLYAQEALFSNLEEKPLSGGQAVIESYLCDLHPGKSIADSDAAIDIWKPVFEKAVASAGASSFVARRTPIISGSGFDLAYFAVWKDTVAYAAGNEALRSNPANVRSSAAFEAAHRCDSTLFTSKTMVPPPS